MRVLLTTEKKIVVGAFFPFLSVVIREMPVTLSGPAKPETRKRLNIKG